MQFEKKKLFIHMGFLEPACNDQHGYQVLSVNSGFIDIKVHKPMLHWNKHLWAALFYINLPEHHFIKIFNPTAA